MHLWLFKSLALTSLGNSNKNSIRCNALHVYAWWWLPLNTHMILAQPIIVMEILQISKPQFALRMRAALCAH